ncbi:hypothetical protein [Luteibacter sp. 9133]|uniref:hypothetical protein n=1 Tax=Luteibacter sp. 9133 TaxID=1500891 RepID=UPI0005BE1AE2|nr:hypothetical protein [Luteibacter sp. 9133]
MWLHRAATVSTETLSASILEDDPKLALKHFWPLYAKILTMIIRANNADESMDAHPLTRYYHEITESSVSSNWIWCLTLASAIEGVIDLLSPRDKRPPAFSETWQGCIYQRHADPRHWLVLYDQRERGTALHQPI